MAIAAAAFAMAVASPSFAAARAGDGVVEIVGPRATEALAQKLVGAVGDPGGGPRLKYRAIDLRSAALEAVVAGIDIVLIKGGPENNDLLEEASQDEAGAWSRHLLGARAVALITHRRNPIDSMSVEQLRLLFSRKARDWEHFGGANAPIRRYGLRPAAPSSVLFHERVLPVGRCGVILRRKNSEDVIKAIASDPQAVGFIDAADTAAVGNSVKVWGLTRKDESGRQAGDPVLPDAASVRDGTYPLSEQLVADVAAEAGESTRAVLENVLSTDGRAILRDHGYLPTIGRVRNTGSAAFNRLYGREVRQARSTPSGNDDLALASELVETAVKLELASDVVEAMCETAFELARSVEGGRVLGFKAATALRRKGPGLHAEADAELMRAQLYLDAYEEHRLAADAERGVRLLMNAANMQTKNGRHAEALRSWRRALAVAEQAESDRLSALKSRMPAFEARVEALAERSKLTAQLRRRPDNPALKERMLKLLVIELDDPESAMAFLSPRSPESFKTHLPLAGKELADLEVESVLSLAEWYVELLQGADEHGAELVEQRASAYYRRFFQQHNSRHDALAGRAKLGLHRLGKDPETFVAEADRAQRDARRRRHRRGRLRLHKGERVTSTRLAEFISLRPRMTRVSSREIGKASAIRDLRPLTFLDSLSTLHLDEAAAVSSLQPLADLPSLKNLHLSGIKTADVGPISEIEGLESLTIRDTEVPISLRPLDSLNQLKSLDLSGCEKVSDLSALAQLKSLEKLTLAGCSAVSDLSPLTELGDTLTSLDIGRIGKVDDVEPLAALENLETLMMRGVEPPHPDDIEWLRRKLPGCRIYH